ncbi:uncharacterized protein LOC126766604, partial [Bactrocera neohumeralis]|uniref:uncharacterized protein LOC126766604 n=1 Tax=Bactrocera neohumeralis TaxID=98809 RepID=UPI0021655E78
MSNTADMLQRQMVLQSEISARCDQNKLEDVKVLWSEFHSNHVNLAGKVAPNHEYFAKNVYEKLRQKCEAAHSRAEELKMERATQETEIGARAISPTNKMIDDIEQAIERRSERIRSTIAEVKIKANIGDETDIEFYENRLKVLWSYMEKNIDELTMKYNKPCNILELEDLSFEVTDTLRVLKKQKEMNLEINLKKTEKLELPKIELQKFSGEFREWQQFKELFEEYVHNNEDISDSKKMSYLKSCLQGDAKLMVSHLITGSGANYNTAWELLARRYDNVRKQFNDNIERLVEIPQLTDESAYKMKKFLDVTNECISIIRNKGTLEEVLAQLVLRKFSKQLLREYENTVRKPTEIQDLSEVISFLEHQYSTQNAMQESQRYLSRGINLQQQNQCYNSTTETKKPSGRTSFRQSCKGCQMQGHDILRCDKFQKLNVERRLEVVRKHQLCFKCLGQHTSKSCFRTWKCMVCDKSHNTLLHEDKPSQKISSNMAKQKGEDTFLATAIIKVVTPKGELDLRALIDSGSQKTLISEEGVQMLGLPKIKVTTEISGVSAECVEVSRHKVRLEIKPRFNSKFIAETEALVLSKLHKALPINKFEKKAYIWKNKILADPNFNKPSRIDVVIGADLYPKIMKKGIIKADGLLGQATMLGWIVSGNIERSRSKEVVAAMTTFKLDDLERFWEMEKDEEEPTPEDAICEENYIQTTTRDSIDGRFRVAIPFKKVKELGESRKTAVARLMSMERKFDARKDLKDDYTNFMREYQKMGHMKEVEKMGQGKYYLPHQAVIKKESTTTKLRVVFDASAKTTNGHSLNDVMLIGPRLQKDIVDIIVKWRMWRYVMSADVEKMYRQIKIREEDQEYQYIVWRENPQEKIKEFKLTTVTYGTAAAPFLAVRTLQEIGNIYCKDNKNVHDVINNDFYMDDLMTGGHTIQECKELREKLIQALQSAGFHLRKWLSNSPEIIDNLKREDNEIVQIEETDSVKTLGLQWEPKRDLFKFKAAAQQIKQITKRSILSQLAKIFDPLGWLAPVTIVGRCFMQKLWSTGGSWDEPLNKEIEEEWLKFAKQLDMLDKITIPRWIGTYNNISLELHAFGDASDKAYAAVIYAKVGQQVTLLLAKSKVNPIKNRKTIPKLELCGAHLLAKILKRTKKTLNLQCKIYAWSDSMVTLAWIQNKNNKEKFVRTRVNDINEMIPEAEW